VRWGAVSAMATTISPEARAACSLRHQQRRTSRHTFFANNSSPWISKADSGVCPSSVNLLLILVSRRAIENNDLTPLLRLSFSAARMFKLITPRANRRGTGQRRVSVKGDA
jgi:hypothetical protein